MQASWGTFQGPVGEMAISWWEGRVPEGFGEPSLSESVLIHLRERHPLLA